MLAENHRYSFLLIVVMLLSLLGIFIKGDTNAIEFQQEVTFPLTIQAGGVYENGILSKGVSPKLLLTLVADNAVYIKVGESTDVITCNESPCKAVIVLHEGITPIEVFAEKTTVLKSLSYSLVKYKRVTSIDAVDGNVWGYVVAILSLLIVFSWIAAHSAAVVQWSVIAATSCFIVYADPVFAVIFFVFMALFYFSRYKIGEYRHFGSVAIAIGIAILFLLLWKYGQEGIYSIFANPGGFSLLMPLGVSYFVIRLIDTILRWFRAEELDISFREFIHFIIFPGTLIAGPIENIRDFYANKITRITRYDAGYAIGRIVVGIFKKLVVADGLLYPALHGQSYAHLILSTWGGVNEMIVDPAAVSGVEVMLFGISGLLYAYIDFSAYSDIAIGVSRLFGYRISENFNFPVLASNIREYWKRWHMSLSNWSFRNIYFPALVKTRNSFLPLYLTMMVIGLWHAFSYSWYFWAVHHASGMTIVGLFQKYFPSISKSKSHVLTIIATVMTIVFASMGFVFVYFDDFSIASVLYLKYWGFLLFGAF